jgi:vacuolar protein sorting-associated protein 13A/C
VSFSSLESFSNCLYLASVLIQHAEDIPEPKETAIGQDLYFEVLELQPIKLSLSFMRTERVSTDDK